MVAHSEYSPSRLSRILACPGSVQACRDHHSKQTSKYAEEGTLLHLAMAKAAEGAPIAPDMLHPIMLDKEQCEALHSCKKYLEEITVFSTFTTGLESAVTLEGFSLPDIYGTCDVIVRQTDPKAIHIIDWKFGKGIPVFAEENDQLIAYALGAIEHPRFLNMYEEIWIHIAQPRLNSFSRYLLSRERLAEWVEKAQKAVLISKTKNPPIIPGGKQCRWCDVKSICAERLANAEKIAQSVFAAHIEQQDNCLDLERLSTLLLQIPQLELYISDLQDYAKSRLLAGQEFPHFKIVEGRSTRQWLDEDRAMTVLDEHNIEYMEAKVKSPAKIEKELTPAQRKELWFLELVHKPSGAPTMVCELDKRSALVFQPFKAFLE